MLRWTFLAKENILVHENKIKQYFPMKKYYDVEQDYFGKPLQSSTKREEVGYP